MESAVSVPFSFCALFRLEDGDPLRRLCPCRFSHRRKGIILDGRLELTNNLAERTVKPFVMARKNFLFCDTAKGADASALCFSVMETAKRNGLDPFGYLLFLLQELPKLGENPAEEQLTPLLPWAETLPDYCKLK